MRDRGAIDWGCERKFRWAARKIAVGLLTSASFAQPGMADDIFEKYQQAVAPVVREFCRECHGPDLAEAEIDFDRFAGDVAAEWRRDPEFWIRVADVLDTQQMPPRDAQSPSGEQRQLVLAWIKEFLEVEAARTAGDPGPVVLRRLSNAQYTYTLRDLTGIDDLDPARDFPIDGAAGEGFTNTGNALVMSPALVTKYFDAAKQVAEHAVLLPDGIEFSRQTTPADWTNEKLAAIRKLYERYTAADSHGEAVDLQGVVFDTNQGGRLPLQPYLQVLYRNARELQVQRNRLEEFAANNQLSPRYLGLLCDVMSQDDGNPLLQPLRAAWWRAGQGEVPDERELADLLQHVQQWQAALFRFTTVGHIGKAGGPTRWLEPVDPLVSQIEIRSELPAATAEGQVEFSLLTTPLSDAAGPLEGAHVACWRNPRLTAPGRRDIPLRDLAAVVQQLRIRQHQVITRTASYLAAAAEVQAAQQTAAREAQRPSDMESPAIDVVAIARNQNLDPELFESWLGYLGLAQTGTVSVEGHLTTPIRQSAGYDFVRGWSSSELPAILANSSAQEVHIPGRLAPQAIVVHPTPTQEVGVGWQSPLSDLVDIAATVTHAHPECGNGVTWRLEIRRPHRREVLGQGVSQGGSPVAIEPIKNVRVERGDLIALLIGPRDADHSCDLTEIQMRLALPTDSSRGWDLAADISPDILAGNPHQDRLGNPGVWHFFSQPVDAAVGTEPALPRGSLLARWLEAPSGEAQRNLAEQIQTLLAGPRPSDPESPDGQLFEQLTSWQGPLVGRCLRADLPDEGWSTESIAAQAAAAPTQGGLRLWTAAGEQTVRFGPASSNDTLGVNDLRLSGPAALWVELPGEFAAGYTLAADVQLDAQSGGEGSVQAYIIAGKVAPPRAGQPGKVTPEPGRGTWTDAVPQATSTRPILVGEGSPARQRLLGQLAQFRELFPPALCYAKIVPVDEVVTLTLFYREDDHLRRLMLSESEAVELDRRWAELHFVSGDALKLQDAYEQLMEYATQDGDPTVFEPLRQPISERAREFRQAQQAAEPEHVEAVIAFAGRAYRRPLAAVEADELCQLYRQLRAEELDHDQAIRLMLARVLVAPAFLYRLETPPGGVEPGPLGDFELANRLSYFLWSSLPDPELLRLAAAGELSRGEQLYSQAQRMLRDPRASRLAEEFAAYWLHIQNFDEFDEKSEQYFPTFGELRGPMYQESLRFFDHLLRNDVSILDIVAADYSFVNGPLAEHYGIPGVAGEGWQRVVWPREQQRAGILGQATFLASQAGASRTSPILRGNWVSEVLLGEKLPKPPQGVPPLPEDPAGRGGLTMRQVVERHGQDPRCAVCHTRIDPYGFALESFDSIGRWRSNDESGLPLDVAAQTRDGYALNGPAGLRDYLLGPRRADFVRQFCRKLLGFALGRGVQLSDSQLLDAMQQALEANDYRFSAALQPLLASRQFREIRGQAWEAPATIR